MRCKAPRDLFFNDLDNEAAKHWIAKLQTQPAEGWDRKVTYCGWRKVPSVYLVCEKDQCIPAPLQLQMAEIAGSEVETCEAGHMPMISLPERVVDVIAQAANMM